MGLLRKSDPSMYQKVAAAGAEMPDHRLVLHVSVLPGGIAMQRSLAQLFHHPCAYRASTDKYHCRDWQRTMPAAVAGIRMTGAELGPRRWESLLRCFGLWIPAGPPSRFRETLDGAKRLGLAWTAFPRGALAPSLNPESSRHSSRPSCQQGPSALMAQSSHGGQSLAMRRRAAWTRKRRAPPSRSGLVSRPG